METESCSLSEIIVGESLLLYQLTQRANQLHQDKTVVELRGARAAFTPLVKTQGDRDRPKGRILYWYSQPAKPNLRNGW